MVCLICKNSFVKSEDHWVYYNHIITITKARISRHSTCKRHHIIYCHEHTSSTGHFCCALFMSAKGKKEGVIEEEREKRVNSASCALKRIQEQDCLAIPLFSSTLHTSTERKSWWTIVSGSKERRCSKDIICTDQDISTHITTVKK